MLLRKINMNKALLSWHQFVQKKNSEQPCVTRKRKINGVEQTFITQNKLIAGNVEATGRQLILDYIKAYEYALLHDFEPEQEGELPGLYTNSTTLADKRTVSDRTIRNHISKLKRVGLINAYKFHGTRHDYELWISPEVLFCGEMQPAPTENQAGNFAPCAAPAAPKDTNFPHNVAFETTGYLEKKSTDVDKGVLEQQAAQKQPAGETASAAPAPCDMPGGDVRTSNTGNTNTGNTGPLQAGSRLKARLYKPVEAKKQDTGAGGAAPAQKAPGKAVLLKYVENFWRYAAAMLYPGYEFDDTHNKLAKNAIWEGVYRRFELNWSEEEWKTYHDECLKRVDLAEAYFRKHPDKYPPMPWAEFKAGAGYFDRENSRGFCATNDWLVKQDEWQHLNKISAALRQARSDFWKYSKGKARKRLQEKSPMELFKYHENKMKKLGPVALRKFYQQHAPQQKSI